MRILYFCQYFTNPHGAAGLRPYKFARRLVERGHEVTVFCGSERNCVTGLTGPFERGARRGEHAGINIVEIDLNYSNYDGIAKRVWKFMVYATRGMSLALTKDYDLIFCTSTPLTAGLPGIVARWLRNKPFVFEVRDLWPALPKALGMKNPFLLLGMDWLEWISYRSAKRCIGLSPGIVAGIKKRGVPEDRLAMIPNCADLDVFQPRQGERPSVEGVPDGNFVAAFAGTHGIANGVDAVINMAAVLQARGREDITLLLIGNGSAKPELVKQAEALGLKNVVFKDPMPKVELARTMQRADAGMMVLANIEEFYFGTSPNKFFDYIAMGLPVINNYPGWLAEVIGESSCGIAVPPEDPERFADAVMQMADHPDETKAMGQNARQLAEREFGREQLADRFSVILEQAAGLETSPVTPTSEPVRDA